MATRSRSKPSKSPNDSLSAKKASKAASKQKVFFFDEKLLRKSEHFKFEHLYHPGQNKHALFIVDKDQRTLYEVKEFTEPHRSWLIAKNACSNGKLYFTIPMDCTFLALHYLKKLCSDKAISLDNIIDEDDCSVHTFMTEYVPTDHLDLVADVKTVAGMKFYKFNQKKTVAWLAVKTKKLAERLKRENIYCGFNSVSQNYKKSEIEQTEDENDYLRNACDIVGSNIDSATHEELKEYLSIKEMDNKTTNSKRKSSSGDTSLSKKIKLETSLNDSVEEPKIAVAVKEKKVSAKEKALAKGAKGTKSISSFFKK